MNSENSELLPIFVLEILSFLRRTATCGIQDDSACWPTRWASIGVKVPLYKLRRDSMACQFMLRGEPRASLLRDNLRPCRHIMTATASLVARIQHTRTQERFLFHYGEKFPHRERSSQNAKAHSRTLTQKPGRTHSAPEQGNSVEDTKAHNLQLVAHLFMQHVVHIISSARLQTCRM